MMTFLLWILPPVALVAAAGLCAFAHRLGWPCVVAACLALAVAAWQTIALVHSMLGWEWGGGLPPDVTFLAFKLGALAVVVAVDFGAAYALIRARPAAGPAGGSAEAPGGAVGAAAGEAGARETGGAREGGVERRWLRRGVVLMVVAAALYTLTFYVLATTGA